MLTKEKTRIFKIFTCKMMLTKISIDLTDHNLYALSIYHIKTTFQQWYKCGVYRHYHVLIMKHSGYVCRNLITIGVLFMCCVLLYLLI